MWVTSIPCTSANFEHYDMSLVQTANKGCWQHFVFFMYFFCHFYACHTRSFGVGLCLFC